MKISRLILMMFIPLVVIACKPNTSEQQPEPSAVVTDVSPIESNPIEKMQESCQMVLGFDAWEPYQYADVGGKVAGLDIELVETVVTNMGCTITYQQGTWVNLLMALKEGEVDILLGASKTEAREQFALFSDAYRMEEFSLYIRSGDTTRAEFATVADFIQSGSKIGIVEDYLYGDAVSAMRDGPDTAKYFVNAIMGELNIARLLDSDIDGFLEDSFVGASMLRRKALSSYIVAQGITIQTGNAYVMFSKKNVTPEQLATFNQHLAKVKSNGVYQDILAKYSY
jgi:polar amino acid transport system substrate-binding protein